MIFQHLVHFTRIERYLTDHRMARAHCVVLYIALKQKYDFTIRTIVNLVEFFARRHNRRHFHLRKCFRILRNAGSDSRTILSDGILHATRLKSIFGPQHHTQLRRDKPLEHLQLVKDFIEEKRPLRQLLEGVIADSETRPSRTGR